MHRFDLRRDQTGLYCQVPVTDKFVYMPILGTLKSIFRNTDLCEGFLQPKFHEEGIYKDLCDGSYFKENILFSQKKHALQIQLYFDEFETTNPLGSKNGIYSILRNLPPKYNSVLMNIYVVALFHSQDLKMYGFDDILKPLVDDLKILEKQGIQVPFSDSPLFGSVVQVTGDNLGLHGLFGFVESFSATYFCRFCLTSKDESQSVFTEDEACMVFRTKEMHGEHCAVLQENPLLASIFGVKKTCLLNTLQFFHTSDNYAVDLMHDLLEGVVQYKLKLVFHYLVNQKYISLELLSQRIQSFNYGYIERKNRPSGFKMDEASNSLPTLCHIVILCDFFHLFIYCKPVLIYVLSLFEIKVHLKFYLCGPLLWQPDDALRQDQEEREGGREEGQADEGNGSRTKDGLGPRAASGGSPQPLAGQGRQAEPRNTSTHIHTHTAKAELLSYRGESAQRDKHRETRGTRQRLSCVCFVCARTRARSLGARDD
ncbi:uncharacterized protein LOC103147693 [Poecilia formosa]|uniref:uncharacterized protein LOC103147693 n=1 Tax=Poecilia formosa TaxID=48698 RepID=UPI000443B6E7|nr:PREDICTED: uncharacterized protein LOC103147693 [Poecilia formosa]